MRYLTDMTDNTLRFLSVQFDMRLRIQETVLNISLTRSTKIFPLLNYDPFQSLYVSKRVCKKIWAMPSQTQISMASIYASFTDHPPM